MNLSLSIIKYIINFIINKKARILLLSVLNNFDYDKNTLNINIKDALIKF